MTRKGKRILWIVAGIALSPVLVVAMLALLLYVPSVQRWVVDVATGYAIEQTGWDISIGRVRLCPLLDIDLQEVSIHSGELGLEVGHLVVDLDLSSIFSLEMGIEGIDFESTSVDTKKLVPEMRVRGYIKHFHLDSKLISFDKRHAELTQAGIKEADIDIEMQDTMVVDTSQSEPLMWTISLGNIAIENSHVGFHMPGDSLRIGTQIREARLVGGKLDIGSECYQLDSLCLHADSLSYDLPYVSTVTGVDYNHLFLSDIHLGISDFSYCAQRLGLCLRDARAIERSGLQLCQGSALISVVGDTLSLPHFRLATVHSDVEGRLNLPFTALQKSGAAAFFAQLKANVGIEDLKRAIPDFSSYLPTGPIALGLRVSGNMNRLQIDTLRILAEPWASLDVNGTLTNVLESAAMGGNIRYFAQTYDMRQVIRWTGLQKRLHIPRLTAQGQVNIKGQEYALDSDIRQGGGRAHLYASYMMPDEDYSLMADIRNFQLHHFLPKDSLFLLTAKARIKGHGFDPQQHSTRTTGYVKVEKFGYGRQDLGGISANIRLAGGHAHLDFLSQNVLLRAKASLHTEFSRRLSEAHLSLSLNRIDLHGLGIMERPFAMGMLVQMDGSTNLRDNHRFKGIVREIELSVKDTVFHPQDMDIDLLLSPNMTHASTHAGDLDLDFSSSLSVNKLFARLQLLSDALDKQIKDNQLNQPLLKRLLPDATFTLRSGRDNPVSDILKTAVGIQFNNLDLSMQCDSLKGFNGSGHLKHLLVGGMQLDTLRFVAAQDTITDILSAHLHVANNAKNKQVVFHSDLHATLAPAGVGFGITFHDKNGKKGVDLGAMLDFEQEGVRLRLAPLHPILAYRHFTLNPDNFIFLHNDRRLEANVDLLADDGTGFKLYTTPNEEALQDITLSVHRFNMGELSAVIPYMPSIEGMLGGDVHFVQDAQHMSFSVDARINKMKFEGAALGTIGLNATYLPNADGTHFIDAILLNEEKEVATLSGTYDSRQSGLLDIHSELLHLPLALANGFFPNGEVKFTGYVDGALDIKGSVNHPMMNGQISTDSMFVLSDMYSLNLRLPNDTLIMRNSQLLLNRIEAYSKGRSPLLLDGAIDMRNLTDIGLNLNVQARNFELINAMKKRGAVAYGKVYVDLSSRLTGTLSNMQLRGLLRVLGKTDVTYVLTDSPLTVDDQLSSLVKFVDFTESDTIRMQQQIAPQNVDMRMNVSIEEAARVHCLLSPDGTNYIDLQGGGDLMLTYNTLYDMRLQGRYTIINGEMNYSLMVLSLRDCKIKSGSYVEFTGDMMNPVLHLSATERIKTTIYENKVPRSVNFEVGIDLSKTLNDIGMAFTINAPGDLALSNQLAALTPEGRGKVAVTMLATGMYLEGEANTQGFSGTNALNSFLQSQIANISNKALSTVDLEIGVDNTNTASGSMQTDYSFSFAKRFWDNRITLVIGGKVSSGKDVQNTGQSIVDNVSIEYRLDNATTRYVRLYYDRSTENLMEGEISEMGAGVVLRRKSTRLGDLFIFKKKQ